MVYWRHRHFAYKVSFCGLVFSILVYVIGFALPYWAVLRLNSIGKRDTTLGLWQACVHPSLTCISYVHGSNPPWINAARAMCTLSLLLFLVVLWCGCYRNISRYGQQRCHSPGRHIECLAVVSCVVGFVGCIIFATEFHRVYVHDTDLGHLYWAFAIVCSTLSFAGVCACVMFIFNRNRYHLERAATTLRARGRHGVPVAVQFPAELGDEPLHIPYFGEISRDQLVVRAVPLQPPSYDLVTAEGSYSNPPGDVSDAPPSYEDIGKDAVLPPEVVAQLESEDKEGDTSGAYSHQ